MATDLAGDLALRVTAILLTGRRSRHMSYTFCAEIFAIVRNYQLTIQHL